MLGDLRNGLETRQLRGRALDRFENVAITGRGADGFQPLPPCTRCAPNRILLLSFRRPAKNIGFVYSRVLRGRGRVDPSRGLALVASVELLRMGEVGFMQAIKRSSVRRYSTTRRRSLIAMVTRRALKRVNGSASVVLVKPFVVMAARVLGPGPTRLRLVKLAHNLEHSGAQRLEYDETQGPAPQPTGRAA